MPNPTQEQFAIEARKWIGVVFKHAGRDEWGVDCIGLVIKVANALGLTDYDTTNYGRVVNPDFFREQIERFCNAVKEEDIQVGDVLLFRVKGSAQHVGMVVEVGATTKFVHAAQDIGRVVEHPLRLTWRQNLAGIYRFRGD